MFENVLLSLGEMYKADGLAVDAGVPGLTLMEDAGAAVVEQITARWEPCRVAVLCGPGNNGGDGFVIARLLAGRGWSVSVALLGDPEKITGDARINADRWVGDVAPLAIESLDGSDLVVDALFGAGLGRAVDGVAAQVIAMINQQNMPCVAVDVPSGVDGNTGAVMGIAPQAVLTVTFFRAKPGHFLRPGRDLCGELVVADIGIPVAVLDDIAPNTFANGPGLWDQRFPRPGADDHKYSRGHAVICGGAQMTGAARLAARAARRVGAGLVTIAAPSEAFAIYAAGSPGNLIAKVDTAAELANLLADQRRNAVLVGPGAGDGVRERVEIALAANRTTVIDADGLTVFADDPQTLFDRITSPTVLTPHEGEFARLFPGLADGDRLTRTRSAASRSGAVVLLKGADTVIAAPDGRAAICGAGTPDLATAGSGDVLAGLIVGLMAQGMTAFDAACAANWLHGNAARAFGPGLIAEDLPEELPGLLRALRTK